MGSPPEEAGRYWHEDPQHKVHLSPFYMTDKEITNAQYGQFLTATGHTTPLYWLDKNLNAPDQPVVGVTWQDAVDFAKWLSQVTGEEYRLPTEAQWEAASRGGLTGQPFPWGNQPPENGQRFLANYNPNPYDREGFRFSAPVGSFPPNGYGLFDMAGNVAEWCWDWYDPTYYTNSQVQRPPAGRLRADTASSEAAPGIPGPGSYAAPLASFLGLPEPMASSGFDWCVRCRNNFPSFLPMVLYLSIFQPLSFIPETSDNIYRL